MNPEEKRKFTVIRDVDDEDLFIEECGCIWVRGGKGPLPSIGKVKRTLTCIDHRTKSGEVDE